MYLRDGTPIVIDNGSGMCKSGYSGDDAPMNMFPSYVGRPKYENEIYQKQIYIGKQAQPIKKFLKLSYPIEYGLVHDWQDMTTIWKHCFYNELKVTPSDHPCLMTEGKIIHYLAPHSPKKHRQRMTEIMFETFGVPAFYLALSGPISLYPSGKTIGTVLTSGDGLTYAISVYEGYFNRNSIITNRFAGRDLNKYFQRLLEEIRLYYYSTAELETIRDMKEKCCYVALQYDEQFKKFPALNQIYELPDGRTINIEDQRFRCAESLFKPQNIGVQMPGIHEITNQSIQQCDKSIRKQLYSNIVISGGTTMFTGLCERFEKEMIQLVSSSTKVKVVTPKLRQFQAWKGGSILSSLNTFQTLWISKAEFHETGASIIHKKCMI